MDHTDWMEHLKQLNRRLVIEKLVRDDNRQQIIHSGLLGEVGITLGSEQCVLLMVDILDYTPGKFDIFPARKTDRDAVMHGVMEQMFISCFGQRFNAYSFLSDGQSYILLNLKTEKKPVTEEWLSKFMEQLENACAARVAHAKEAYGMEIRVYVSSFILTLDELGRCKTLLDHMLADDFIGEKTSGVFTADKMKAQMLAANEMNDQLYMRIRHILELTQKHRLQEAGQATIDMLRLESQHYGIAASSRSRLEGLITVLYAIMEIPYFGAKNESLDMHEVLMNIEACLSITELIDYIQQLFQDFEKYFSGAARSKLSRVEDIVDYINANYSDPLLCATMICDHFEINHTYLSRLFKEMRSEKLIDYIHKTRIRHAKVYLSATSETIDLIAQRVGYQNTLTFARAFKRYEGVTPGAFRSNQFNQQP